MDAEEYLYKVCPRSLVGGPRFPLRGRGSESLNCPRLPGEILESRSDACGFCLGHLYKVG